MSRRSKKKRGPVIDRPDLGLGHGYYSKEQLADAVDNMMGLLNVYVENLRAQAEAVGRAEGTPSRKQKFVSRLRSLADEAAAVERTLDIRWLQDTKKRFDDMVSESNHLTDRFYSKAS